MSFLHVDGAIPTSLIAQDERAGPRKGAAERVAALRSGSQRLDMGEELGGVAAEVLEVAF